VNYYENVIKTVGDTAKAGYRLYLVPGMNHCGGGDGATNFEMVGAMEQWVEKGEAPDQILASHRLEGSVDFTRPLCPYPQSARYSGSGSDEEAANFVCVERK
jgi:feruloyl esterase